MFPDHIRFAANPGQAIKEFLDSKGYSKIGVLVDEHTMKYCYPLVRDFLPEHFTIEIPPGEELKNLGTCVTIWEEITNRQLDRHAVLIVLGGGVLGDMGGFCAATYKRGIDFVLIPTTLLAMADASIGGKLGIDFQHFKNHIGTFKEPALTLICEKFLETLPRPELLSGFAEVIKHTLISDPPMFRKIATKNLDQDWPALLHHSVAYKYRVTEADPKEKGLRKVLNTGHTIGHAVETWFLKTDKRILHGEAVAAGIIMEAWIAVQRGMLSSEELEEITVFIKRLYPKLHLNDVAIAEISTLAMQDKKNRDGKILCVLLDGIGKAKWDCEITPDEIRQALAYYRDQT